MVLLKQVASYLAMPIFVVDEHGALTYYNEAAEALLGNRYEETGPLALDDWAAMFTPTDPQGQPIPPEELPIALAVRHRRPAQDTLWILGLDGVTRRLSMTAIPLQGPDERLIGAVAVFWEG